MTVNKVLAANREKLMEILRENYTGDPKTSWGNILDNVVDWFERYCAEFGTWVRKISWRRAWQPTPVFLPGESHGQRSLAGTTQQHC